MSTSTASAPLAGIFVLDLSELLPGPFLTQSLLDMGAEVLKVERPPHGDNARTIGPGTFESVNRGKRSMVADLKNPDDREKVRALIKRADVLVEGYRPGVMARLGLDYPSVKEQAPRLIYASLTGFGQQGPDALLPGHDINYLASAGTLAISGDGNGAAKPKLGLPVADLAGAMAGLSAVLAALYQRTHTGKGQYLDIALSDSVLHWMNPRFGQFAHAGLKDAASQRAMLHNKPGYGVFRCADGRDITVAALEEHFWAPMNRELGLFPEDDEICGDYGKRTAAGERVNKRLAEVLATLDSKEAVRRLKALKLPVVPVLSVEEAPAYARQKPNHPVVDTPRGPRIRFPVYLEGMPEGASEVPGLGTDNGAV